MVGICYHSQSARNSAAYEPSYARKKADKRSRKNLFKTALDKLTRKHKETKAASENVYEVCFIYKDQHDNSEVTDHPKHNSPKSEHVHCQTSQSEGEPPKAPPRTRSRPQSRSSCKNYEEQNLPPTRPPRSRSLSQRSSIIILDTPPTPPPRTRSRPHSRNSCKGSIHKSHETSSCHQDLQYANKSDLCKPPIPPTRSPLRNRRKQLAGKSKDQTKSIRKSVSLADLGSGLDYIDIDEIEESEHMCKSTKTNGKLYNSDEMFACNAKMDSRWAVVKNSSNLSLNMPSSVKVQETYLGPEYSPGWSADHRTQSYSKLAVHQLDASGVPENSLGQLAPMEGVKLSLGRLDIPDWYMARPTKEDNATVYEQRTAWKKGSFPNLPNPTSKSTPCSPVPPSSPSQIHSSWMNNLRDKIPQTVPTPSKPQLPPAHKPYTGWRSQEKLPTFLPEGRSSRLEEEKIKIRPLEVAKI